MQPEQLNKVAYMPELPTLESEAQPQHLKTDASRLTLPAHQHSPALRGNEWSHPIGLPTTSINAYPRGRSSYDPVLAAENWPQDSTLQSASAQQDPPPRPVFESSSDVAIEGHTSSAQPIWETYFFATSSPQTDHKPSNNIDFSPSVVETHNSHFMNLQPPETMQTPPVSAHPSPNDRAMDDQQSRKRSHSIMSNEQDFTQQMIAAATSQNVGLPNGNQQASRSASVISGGVETDGYSGRGSRAFKRGDPPQNEHGKYTCDYTEDCRDVTFDRKCEWSKHMDKHDRPYRCPHQSCGKLQGFTYSGGLLRHEREVHGKHGGPKAQLMCPHSDCKRHAGKGFTRKENLNEHLRRVHFSRNPNSQDAGTGADDEDAAVDSATQDAIAALTASNSTKRKRVSNDDMEGVPSEADLLRQEVAMLRAEIDSKDAVIQDLTRQLAHGQQNQEQTTQESVSNYQQSQHAG